jgi:ribosomal protein S17E
LASKGKVTKLNSPTNSFIHGSSQKRKENILKSIVDCVGDDRAEDISNKLNGYITRIEEEKQKIKDEEKRQKNITSIK